jgi:hypothetical protein
MKASELRIGNLVIKSLKSGNGRKVFSKIGCQDIVKIVEGIGSFNYEPILLNEHILLFSLGFNNAYKKGYVGIDFKNQDFVLTEPLVLGEFQTKYAFQYNVGRWSKFKEFTYVHELQNFYYEMTGEELKQM